MRWRSLLAIIKRPRRAACTLVGRYSRSSSSSSSAAAAATARNVTNMNRSISILQLRCSRDDHPEHRASTEMLICCIFALFLRIFFFFLKINLRIYCNTMQCLFCIKVTVGILISNIFYLYWFSFLLYCCFFVEEVVNMCFSCLTCRIYIGS